MKILTPARPLLFLLLLLLCPLHMWGQSDTEKKTDYTQLIDHARTTGNDSGGYYAQQGLLYYINKRDVCGQADMILALAGIDMEQGRYEQARIRGLYAISLYRQRHSIKDVVIAQNFTGAIEASRRNSRIAEEYFSTALELHDSIPTDNAGLMLTYMNLGKLYLQNRDTAGATRYLTMAEQVSKKVPVYDSTIAMYNYIAELYMSTGNEEQAMKYLQNNIQMSDRPELSYAHAQSLYNLGRAYNERGDASKALGYWNEALGIARAQHMQALLINILLSAAEIVRPEYAGDYIDEAMGICGKMHNPMTRARLYGEMAMMYERQGKYMNALYASKKQNKIIDSLDEINRNTEYKSKGTLYQLEKSNSRVKQLELLSRKNKVQSTTITIVSVLLVIALGITIVMYRRTRKLNSQLVSHERELNNLNTTKNKLFSIIGHDLRAPMAKIYTVLDLYNSGAFTEEEKPEILDSLKEHVKATFETLDKLLYWGQTLLKGVSMQQLPFESKHLIRQNIELKRTAAEDKHITVTDNTPEHLTLFADSTHFDFVLRNLLANAIKFTNEHGHIDINSDEEKQEGYVIFSVKDDGVGIPADKVAKIFEPFHSTDGTANEKGTGMGLMLCKEFVMQNGGNMWVESQQGKGTTFYFSFKKEV